VPSPPCVSAGAGVFERLTCSIAESRFSTTHPLFHAARNVLARCFRGLEAHGARCVGVIETACVPARMPVHTIWKDGIVASTGRFCCGFVDGLTGLFRFAIDLNRLSCSWCLSVVTRCSCLDGAADTRLQSTVPWRHAHAQMIGLASRHFARHTCQAATRPVRVSPHEWCSVRSRHAHTHTHHAADRGHCVRLEDIEELLLRHCCAARLRYLPQAARAVPPVVLDRKEPPVQRFFSGGSYKTTNITGPSRT
jgi:hypothetical protein